MTVQYRLGFLFILAATSSALAQDRLDIRRSRVTGLATFVRAADGGAIAVDLGNVAAVPGPMDFLRTHGPLFGVADPATQLVPDRAEVDDIGFTHTSFRQVHQGVSVFGGTLRLHQDAVGAFRSANGNHFPIPAGLNTVPTLTSADAVAAARGILNLPAALAQKSELTIVDPGWYGDPPAGVHLAYHVVLSDPGVREAFFVDAHSGKLLDRWSLLENVKDRVVVYEPTSTVVRVEGGAATGDPDQDMCYDYSGDTYDYLFNAFNRDGIDGVGGTLVSFAHLDDPSCPNAFGGGGQAAFCDGIVTDDIVAHEFGHSLTEDTAGLIYQNQSGQLNESFSDVIGEIVDLLNGDVSSPGAPGGTPWPPSGSGPGTDTPNTLRTACVAGAVMEVNSPGSIAGNYAGQPATFGAALTPGGTSADLVVASPVRGCNIDLPFSNAGAMLGKIVLLDRGDCAFSEKVKNAQNAGALGAIVANNVPDGLAPMGGADGTVVIPSLGISQADGATLKNEALSSTVNVTIRSNATPDVRWLVGEDSAGFGGAIRDMWQPSCFGHPDTANHPFETCPPEDNGGVHSGSGVPNHAFAILTDGKSFNSITTNPIGLFKAGAVWHRALTNYLTSTADFNDAYNALNQAAADLIGENIRDPRDGSIFDVFTSADAVEVNNALLAVEMNTQGRCGANEVLDSSTPPPCTGKTLIYSDSFESGFNGWIASVTGPGGPPTPYNWVQRSTGLPAGLTGTAWFAEDRDIGNCNSATGEAAVHSLFSPSIVLPNPVYGPTLAFTHYVESEAGWDGGNVAISVNGGTFQVIPAALFEHNRYNTALLTVADGNNNPIAGQPAFSGGDPGNNNSGRSIIDLSTLATGGQTVRFRFNFGKDRCVGVNGWFVDDFELYQCPNTNGAPLIVWNADTLSPARATRSLTFSTGGVTATAGAAAIAVKMLDLQHPVPSNPVCCPPLDFSTYESSTCTAAGETNGCIRWVGPVQTFYESTGNPLLGSFRGARLQCTPYYTDWSASGDISVTGAEIVPSSSYELQSYAASCKGVESTCADVGPPVTVLTRRWGDIASSYNPPSSTSQPDAIDVASMINKFSNKPGAPLKRVALIKGQAADPNFDIDGIDVVSVVDAFRGLRFPYLGPCSCPSTFTCDATPCTSSAQCPGGTCVKTCVGGGNDALLCVNNGSCPDGTCGAGFCRDRCSRCTP